MKELNKETVKSEIKHSCFDIICILASLKFPKFNQVLINRKEILYTSDYEHRQQDINTIKISLFKNNNGITCSVLSELRIRRGNMDNSEIIFLISQHKHTLGPSTEPSPRRF